MTGGQEKSFKRDVIERLNKAKERFQQSVPEIRQYIKASGWGAASRPGTRK